MQQLFQLFFYQPIFNAFIGFYDILPDVGIVILIITILIKLILWPLTAKGISAQRSMSELQPKLEAVKLQHKGDQQTIAQETLKLYKEHKVNPFGSCLPLLVQIPVFLALFWVLKEGLSGDISGQLYSFVPRPEHINSVSLGVFDLAKPSIVMAVLAGIAQFFQARTMTKKQPKPPINSANKDENMMAIMNKQMMYMLPFMTVIISVSLPAGVAWYWLLSTVFTILQQWLMTRSHTSAVPAIIEGEIVDKK